MGATRSEESTYCNGCIDRHERLMRDRRGVDNRSTADRAD